jgi:pyrimidine-nucleoside phosphorylase
LKRIIARKRGGEALIREEIASAVNGYVDGSVSDHDMTGLLRAIFDQGMDDRELSDLTEIMIASGVTLSLEGIAGKKIDKHSTGGVGDKVSLVVAPIVAACGVMVPMISGRGLGHTGGTLDKLESIPGFNVALSSDDLRRVLDEAGMVICSQTEDLVPADRKIYALRDATDTVGCIPLIASSIMSKKLALGTDGIVLDVKTGKGAFMRSEEYALDLCRNMVSIGERHGRPTVGLITNMDQPLGNAVGHSLEVIEAIEALKGNGPDDLMEVVLALGAQMLILAGHEASAVDQEMKQAVGSGGALEIFRRFIKAQGGDENVCTDYSLLPVCTQRIDIKARTDGYVHRLDPLAVSKAAATVPLSLAAGVILHRKVGDAVETGDRLLTAHTPDGNGKSTNRLHEAVIIKNEPVARSPQVLYRVDKAGLHDHGK